MQQLQNDIPGVARLGEGLREVTAAFAAVVADLDPRQQVPSCPEWAVHDLVGHIGQAHRWAAELVRTRAAAPVPDPAEAEPGEQRDWPRWLAAGAEEVVDAVAATGPDTPVWTFVGERPAAFWPRRMLADTVVHLADAALTAGRAPVVAPDLAADAISEGLELISHPDAATLKPDLAALRGEGQTLGLRPDEPDVPGWTITRTPAGVGWERGVVDADVLMAAPVRDLMLVFSRRRSPTEAGVAVSGDAALLEHWRAHTAF